MKRKTILQLFLILPLLWAGALTASAQKIVKGLVVDAEGTPLPGVSVVVRGKEASGTTTTIDGKYAVQAEAQDSLTFSYVGFTTKRERVGQRDVIDVVMKEDDNTLEETVVVAFAKQKKNSVIGSIETINPAELKTPTTNLTNTLAGRIAGVISYQRSGEPGRDNANFFIRGVSTINSALAGPLILIDGVEMSTEDLARLEPENIASFSIMKDATATALYGSKGANGVILVTTKSGRKGKTKITTRVETQISTPTKILEFVDGIDYMNLYNYAVRTRDIIAIYDYVGFFVKDNPDNKRYFARCKAEGKVWRTTASMDLVKSIVITKDRIYLSGISTLALKNRTRAIYDMGK